MALITDIEILRLHYADTRWAWRGRFLTRREEAKKDIVFRSTDRDWER